MLKFIRRKRRKTGLDKAEEESERVDAVEYFTRKLTYLLQVLVSAYYDSMLKWYELIAVIVCGVLAGIGMGVAIYAVFVRPQPTTIIIPLNETHIIRVRP